MQLSGPLLRGLKRMPDLQIMSLRFEEHDGERVWDGKLDDGQWSNQASWGNDREQVEEVCGLSMDPWTSAIQAEVCRSIGASGRRLKRITTTSRKLGGRFLGGITAGSLIFKLEVSLEVYARVCKK